MIRKGDNILVFGESDEVFTVIGVKNNMAMLHTGVSEPIDKCIRIPDKYKDEICSVIKSYLPTDIAMKLFNP